MTNAIRKIYTVMSKSKIVKAEAHYFEKTCCLIFLNYRYPNSEFSESVVLDCERYWYEKGKKDQSY